MRGRFRISIGLDLWLALVATLVVVTLGAAVGVRLNALGPARGGLQALERELLIWLVALFAVLAVGCVFLVWIGTRQQRSVDRASRDANRARASFKRVIEHLPIGFFEFRDGSFTVANGAFQCVLEEYCDDAGASVADCLKEQLQRSMVAGIDLEVPLQTTDARGAKRHFDVRGSLIHGSSDSADVVLGFCYDVTDIVEANHQIKQQRDELGSTNFQLRRALADLQENFEEMVAAWVRAVEAKDAYTAGHSERVMQLAVRIGNKMGLPVHELHILEMGSLIHDIGKIGVPDGILTKAGTLTHSEFDVVRNHPVVGARMIERIPLFKNCVPIVRWHHEKLDGSGYPDGLQGDAISELVRITTVADMFDALTSSRAYREALTDEEALAKLLSEAHKGKIDGKIAGILAEIVQGDARDPSFSEQKAA